MVIPTNAYGTMRFTQLQEIKVKTIQKVIVWEEWTDNEFEQIWEADKDGKLVCSHAHIEREPAQRGDYMEPSWDAYDYCLDCGETLEIDTDE